MLEVEEIGTLRPAVLVILVVGKVFGYEAVVVH